MVNKENRTRCRAAIGVDVERTLCDAVANLPSDDCEAFIAHLGGATNRVGVTADAYGPNFDRLSALKAKYDPANLFSQNQNIPPKV